MGEYFEPGDVVIVRDDVSDGPMRPMTVGRVEQQDGTTTQICDCTWFVGDSRRRGRFLGENLRKV